MSTPSLWCRQHPSSAFQYLFILDKISGRSGWCGYRARFFSTQLMGMKWMWKPGAVKVLQNFLDGIVTMNATIGIEQHHQRSCQCEPVLLYLSFRGAPRQRIVVSLWYSLWSSMRAVAFLEPCSKTSITDPLIPDTDGQLGNEISVSLRAKTANSPLTTELSRSIISLVPL